MSHRTAKRPDFELEPITGDELQFSVFQIRLFLRFSVFFHVSFNFGFSFTRLEFPSRHTLENPYLKNHQKSKEVKNFEIFVIFDCAAGDLNE